MQRAVCNVKGMALTSRGPPEAALALETLTRASQFWQPASASFPPSGYRGQACCTYQGLIQWLLQGPDAQKKPAKEGGEGRELGTGAISPSSYN